MPETWAKGCVDLHLDLDGTRVRASLETALRAAIRTGRLHPGTRLPSSRVLAVDLGIARNTVAEVYSQLVAEGWLTAQTGSGTSVAPRRAADPGPGVQARLEADVPRYDLRAGVPDLSAFPRRAWLATAARCSRPSPLTSSATRIRVASRRCARRWRSTWRGREGSPPIPAYGHQTHRDIAAGQGLRLRPVPVDGMGAVIAEASGADAALLTPAHQFPLGVALHPRRRREAAAWGGIVIEDDYDGEFRYDRQPVGALQALAPDHVVYAGTASKSLAPGLRLGWLVVPPRLLDAVTAELAAGPSGIDQLTLAEFITSGEYDRQIRRARPAYRRRRDRLTMILNGQELRGQGLRISGIAAGLHAVLDCSRPSRERDIIARATEGGLALDGPERFRAAAGAEVRGTDGEQAGLVIGLAGGRYRYCPGAPRGWS